MDNRDERVKDCRESLLSELNIKRNKMETLKAIEGGLEVTLEKILLQKVDVGDEMSSIEHRLSHANKVHKAVQRPIRDFMLDVIKRDDEENGTSYFKYIKDQAIRLKEQFIGSTANG